MNQVEAKGTNKTRIEYIDTAKGICILLVVLYHIGEHYNISSSFDIAIKSFRMPLYFVLSGLFFKPYEGFGGFLRRKTNKLLIPFTFFYLVSIVIWMLSSKRPLGELIGACYFEDNFLNVPIWFLLCLFEVNILFYVFYLISRKQSHDTLCLGILSLICGISGLLLSFFKINFNAYLDSSMSVMPFFFTGYYLGRKTDLLRKPLKNKYLAITICVCLCVVFFFSGYVSYMTNYYSTQAYWTAYLCGICGTILVLALSKWIGRIPLVTYYGRYSIIILCTHILFYHLIINILEYLDLIKLNIFSFMFPCILFSYLLTIPICIKMLPYVTAQKGSNQMKWRGFEVFNQNSFCCLQV